MHVGLRIPGDQRQITPALPLHLVDVVTVSDGVQSFVDASGNNQSFGAQAWLYFMEFIYWIEYQFYLGGFYKNHLQVCI